jgi:hypothetical protein
LSLYFNGGFVDGLDIDVFRGFGCYFV